MRGWACVFLLTVLSTEVQAWAWSDFWSTPDQQAQVLMNKGRFAKAKDKFEREDWSAAAAYKAGDYQRAADLYKKEQSEHGYYNEGNALAHLGQYEKALDAYKKALTINPKNQDAKHNYKLVNDLLKKDKEQQQNKDQQNKEQQQNKDQQNKDQQNKDQQNKDQQNKDQQNKDPQNKDPQNKEQQNKEQQNKEQQNKEQQNKDQKNNDQQSKKTKNKKQQQANAQTPEEKEQQKANEQWLRLIPDDPGGLLREKFLRDHIRRERGWYQ